MESNPIDGYIRQIPEVVATTVVQVREQLASWEPLASHHVVLVGSGTSFNALIAAASGFAIAGSHVDVLTPGALMRRAALSATRPLVLALSQTGASTTTVAALRHATAMDLTTIAMTAEAQSPIARQARRTLLLPVGAEPVGPKTKGYAASLAALFVVADRIAGRKPSDTDRAAQLARVLSATADDARALAAKLDDVDFIAVAGDDRHLGTALEASLKISEMTGVPAAGFTLEEMLHGRLHGLTARSFGILIAADDEQRETSVRAANIMAGHDVRIGVVNLTNQPTDHDWPLAVEWPALPFDAIAAIIPFQQLAAAMSLRRGRAPHRMQYPGLASRLGIRIGVPS